MQIPQPHLRDFFKKIYQGRKINLSASRDSLEEQLNLYLDHLENHTFVKVSQKDRKRIWDIIERNNTVAKMLSSPQYRKIVKRKRELARNVSLGFVFCIDGRIPAIFLGGRFARHFEVPAAQVSTVRRRSDNKLIPDSSDLNEALRRIAPQDDLLEIVLAHTSLSNPHHGCGAMVAKMRAGLIDPKLSLEDANLKIIKEKSIPAITNIYNEFRAQMGLDQQKVVCIAALYDTDTFGIILNYDLRKENKCFSTSDLTNKYSSEIDEYFVKNNLVFGSFKEKFCELKFLTTLSQNILKVTESLLDKKVAPNLLDEVNEYIMENYRDLTDHQKQALIFVVIRNIAFQYLTGLSKCKKSSDHPFMEHGESFLAVAMRGTTIGKFDPQNQAFASTPADPKQAISNIDTMLSIMGDSPKLRPYILFVCNSVNSRDLRENNQVLQRIIGSNAGLLRDIIEDKKLGEMIRKGEMIPVSVLIEEQVREVLKIIDHSGYI